MPRTKVRACNEFMFMDTCRSMNNSVRRHIFLYDAHALTVEAMAVRDSCTGQRTSGPLILRLEVVGYLILSEPLLCCITFRCVISHQSCRYVMPLNVPGLLYSGMLQRAVAWSAFAPSTGYKD